MKRTVRALAVVIIAVATASGFAAGQDRGAVTVVRVPGGGIQPQVAVDASGGVHLVYFKGADGNGDLFYSRIHEDGTFSAPLRVNSQPGSAIATGNVRGARVAAGKDGRVHVTWNGSGQAMPKAVSGATPMLYTRMNTARTAFEAQRNLLQYAVGLDGGGAIAADAAGAVYVAWHAGGPGSKDETTRRVWVAKSVDDGATFAREQPASPVESGACGCCGMGALASSRGSLLLLYRGARELVHRETNLLVSTNGAKDFSSRPLQEWNVGACPMSTYSLTEGSAGILAAWETGGQVQFARLDPGTGAPQPRVEAPGATRGRKHPMVVANARGEVLFVWTEGMSWQRGGTAVWQLFDPAGRPTGAEGRASGVPTWSLVAAYARPDGRFTVVY